MANVYVLGVGLTKFYKPSEGPHSYTDLSLEAGTKALLDAGINYDEVEQGFAGFCYGDSTCGQRAFYQFGMTQIPIVNVNNNCSTGSTALWLARNAIMSGQVDVAMAIGFEEMAAGSLKSNWDDRENPLGRATMHMVENQGFNPKAPPASQWFGNAALEYHEKYGSSVEHLTEIARINHLHSAKNPYSQFRNVHTKEQIEKSPQVHAGMTRLHCCPTSSGAGAAVLVSEKWLDAHPELANQAVPILSQVMATDSAKMFSKSAIELAGADMTRRAANGAFKRARVSPDQIGVIELHDCFSANELISLDALGVCAPGTAHKMVEEGDITYGGRIVVNPSGGLISKGHPLGATGLAQCAELTWQLRGWCGDRQVKGVQYCLQHNVGLGGAVVVGIYGKPEYSGNFAEDGRTRLGYNPATECRKVARAEFDQVKSKQQSADFITAEAKL
jgi:sterol carrier protein 2